MKSSETNYNDELGAENGYLSLIFQNTSDLFCLLEVKNNTELIILSVNPSYLEAAKSFNPKITAQTFLGRSITDVMYEEYEYSKAKAQDVLAKYEEVLETCETNIFIEEFEFKGDTRYYSSSITPITNKEGQCTHLLYASNDITEKKSYEIRLTSREKKFRALIENAYEGIVLYNSEGYIIYASPSVQNIAGYSENDVCNRKGTDFIHPDDILISQDAFKSILSQPGQSLNYRFRLRHADGHYLWSDATLTNLLDKPEVSGIISNFRDITKQKLAEDKARETSQLLEGINQNINEGIYRSVPTGNFKYVNQAFLKMFGFDTLNALNKIHSSKLYASMDKRKEIHEMLLSKKNINNVEVKFKRKDGSEFWGLMSSSLIKGEHNQTYFDGAVRDITKQKIAEEKSRQNEQLLTSISQNITEGIFRTSVHGGIVFANEAFIEIFGYDSEEEVLRINPNVLYAEETARTQIVESIRSQGFVRNKEVELVKKNGDTFWGLYSCSHSKGPQGEDIFDGAVRDITEIKMAEDKLTKLNEELRKQNLALANREEELNVALRELSDRNFELDQLVYKTSHDLRSPLTSILGLVNIAKIDEDRGHQAEYLGRIEKSILKLDEFVRSMLNYAKASRTEVKMEPFELKALIENCITDLEYLESFKQVKTTLIIEGDSKSFTSDPLRLKIIFSNIISNAYKYVNSEVRNSYLKIKAVFTPTELIITFKDNGIGIHRSQIKKIFDMFYRATEKSEGSGLGMYIVKQSINKLGGEISVESKVNVGTTFKIVLPAA
ncbi:PAS domain S-box protein [Fulvivirga ulvae]|uniref:PAS domain-containing sensor histidine kinase n=1 Tax=Fulvivirga ulvae TaxID=2904245 RepID=UPI001F3E6F46|nr:PAS domain S-box protein [Fulvivirga ulvae]UII34094.1 PAS domain S-box protein [Fulvivirga ulvae]